jgi:hypothetical protein
MLMLLSMGRFGPFKPYLPPGSIADFELVEATRTVGDAAWEDQTRLFIIVGRSGTGINTMMEIAGALIPSVGVYRNRSHNPTKRENEKAITQVENLLDEHGVVLIGWNVGEDNGLAKLLLDHFGPDVVTIADMTGAITGSRSG